MENRELEERVAKLEKDLAFLSHRLTCSIQNNRTTTRLNADFRKWAESLLWRLFRQIDPGYISTMKQLRAIIGTDKGDRANTQ